MAIIHPKLHHVTLSTSHLDDMLDWYGKGIGARVMFRNEGEAWTTNDEANHRVAFLAVPGLSDDPDKINHNAMHQSAFEHKSFDDLITSYARRRDEGFTPPSAGITA